MCLRYRRGLRLLIGAMRPTGIVGIKVLKLSDGECLRAPPRLPSPHPRAYRPLAVREDRSMPVPQLLRSRRQSFDHRKTGMRPSLDTDEWDRYSRLGRRAAPKRRVIYWGMLTSYGHRIGSTTRRVLTLVTAASSKAGEPNGGPQCQTAKARPSPSSRSVMTLTN